MDKILVLRNIKSHNWRLMPGDPRKIHPRDNVGYRYYMSFDSPEAAQNYCQKVEQDERDLHDARSVLAHNDNLNQLAFD